MSKMSLDRDRPADVRFVQRRTDKDFAAELSGPRVTPFLEHQAHSQTPRPGGSFL